ncbi:MAG: type II secretion system protein [Verrucomicrobiota bacterium]
MNTYSRQSPSRRAFSLVEVLVAAGVLGVIGLLLVQIVSATSTSTTLSAKAVDASAQARQAFERLRLDLAGRLPREDVDFHAFNVDPDNYFSGSSNPVDPPTALMFVSEVTSIGAEPNDPSGDMRPTDAENRGLSVLNYRIGPHEDLEDATGSARLCLLRTGVPLRWDDTNFIGIGQEDGLTVAFSDFLGRDTAAEFDPLFKTSGADAQVTYEAEPVAEGVIRMVIGFRLFPTGEPINLLGDNVNSPQFDALGELVYRMPIKFVLPLDAPSSSDSNKVAVADVSQIGALVVGLVCLDLESAKLLTNAQIQTLARKFPEPLQDETPLEAWGAIADGSATSGPNLITDSDVASVPLRARQAVRVFQRAYPISLRMQIE